MKILRKLVLGIEQVLRGFLLSMVVLSMGLGLGISAIVNAKQPNQTYESIQLESIALQDLPSEARTTLTLIRQGGPFPYAKDGVVFGNYEARLAKQKRGYYHEFTVPTPKLKNRGARRIVSGGNPQSSGEYYYTDDHYQSFKKIKE